VHRPAPAGAAQAPSIDGAAEPVALPDMVSPVTTLQASPPPPPPAPISPLERPYGWSSGETGYPRSASGEILVQKTPPTRPSQIDVPRVHVREDSGKAYVRKSTATPPGSARALDEPPPIATPEAAKREPSKPVASKTIKIDDGRDDTFSKADAEDELGVSSRQRKALAIGGGALLVLAVIAFAIKGRSKPSPTAADEHEAQELQQDKGTTSAPAPATPPVIVPIPGTPAAEPAAVKPATPVVDTTGAAGRKPPVAPIGTAREDIDERGADPRMARERASETRPLLYVCRMAFDQRRYKDAEGACTAARDANPDSADAHALLAHALFNRNKKRESLTAAERAAKLNPKLAQMYVIIGGVRQEDGDLEEARRAYERYLELEPKGSYAAELKAIISRLPAKL
jgi:hypothetical protein